MKQFKVGDTVRVFDGINSYHNSAILSIALASSSSYYRIEGDIAHRTEIDLELVSHADGTPLTLVEKARLFARTRHHGQFRRDEVTPYFTHCEKVASLVESDFEKAVAYLHDLIEEDRCSEKDLLDEFGQDIADIVDALSKGKDEKYEEFIIRLLVIRLLNTNRGWEYRNVILVVKIADITANLSDSPTEKQVVKYFNALKILAGV